MKALIKGTTNLCNCDSRHLDGNDFGELKPMKGLPVTALRYGGAISSISKIQVQLGSLKCFGKNGNYPSEVKSEEQQALEKRLNILNETLIANGITAPTTTTTTTSTSTIGSSFTVYTSSSVGTTVRCRYRYGRYRNC